MAGDGLVRPLNAPPGRQLQPGIQPGASSPVVIANQVVILGAHGSVLVYSGTPALGNLQLSLAGPVSFTDAHGNFVVGGGLAAYQVSGAQASTVAVVYTTVGIELYDGGAVPVLISFGAAQLGFTAPASQGYLFSVGVTSYLAMVSGFIQAFQPVAATDPASSAVESWHAVSPPAGMTGTIRVKLLAEAKFACLDIDTVITSTNVAPTTYTAGSLPSASYYPAASRQFAVSVNQQWSNTANASPRAVIPTSGAVSLPLPGFNAAGNSCIVSGTVIYPLDL